MTKICPLVGAGGVKITYNSFASACLQQQVDRKKFSFLCGECGKATDIEMGKKVDPPDGIEIIEPNGWTEHPIVFPKKREMKTKYGFHLMDIGDIYLDNTINTNRCRSALYNISMRYNRGFTTKKIDDVILIERVR